MGHQLVCLLKVLAGEQRGVVVISTEFTYDKQALGEELLAFFTTKERWTKGNSVKTKHQHSRNETKTYFKKEKGKESMEFAFLGRVYLARSCRAMA
jgi:hypothetical protein